MARKGPDYATPVRRVLIATLALLLLALFLFWRIDSPRAEQMRTAIVDRIVPQFEWALVPVARVSQMIAGFQSYARLYEQNQELRRELQRMTAWKEAAVQLEQENSKLLALNNVRIDPALTSVTGDGDGRQRLGLPAVGAAERRHARMASSRVGRRWTGWGLSGASRASGARPAGWCC